MGVCGLCVLVILPKMYIFPHFHKQKLAFIYGVRYIVSTQWHFANSIFFSLFFIAVAAFFMVLFSFLFSIDFCMLSCSYIVCTFRMLSWLLYIYWSEDEEKKTHSHEYGLEYPIKWRLYHVLMSFRGRLTKGVNNSIHKNSFQVK